MKNISVMLGCMAENSQPAMRWRVVMMAWSLLGTADHLSPAINSIACFVD